MTTKRNELKLSKYDKILNDFISMKKPYVKVNKGNMKHKVIYSGLRQRIIHYNLKVQVFAVDGIIYLSYKIKDIADFQPVYMTVK